MEPDRDIKDLFLEPMIVDREVFFADCVVKRLSKFALNLDSYHDSVIYELESALADDRIKAKDIKNTVRKTLKLTKTLERLLKITLN